MLKNAMSVHHESSTLEKIALFRSLFRGRQDVYPRRFVSRKTGKKGYAPVCANEWVRGVCEKPRIKCAVCPHRKFRPVTDQVIHQHLAGLDEQGKEFIVGVYPMLLDETCFFLAIDLDKSGWQDDTVAVMDTCRILQIPALLERSSSGNGAHVWIFFEAAIPASLARRLGSYILTETMERRPDIGLESYDRLIPNQDTLPKGGFGNLIALPLQKKAREKGNSVFVDLELQAYADQWQVLSSVQTLSIEFVERIVQDAIDKGRIVDIRVAVCDDDSKPWTLAPSRSQVEALAASTLPERVVLTLANQIYISREGLSPQLHNRLIKLAAFQNPEFFKAQAMRLPTWGKPRVISCAEIHSVHIALPRGCIEEVVSLFKSLKVEVSIDDQREVGEPLDLTFKGELRVEQKTARRKLLAYDTGVLAATTAFGKTVVAASIIADRATSVVQHTNVINESIYQSARFIFGISLINRIKSFISGIPLHFN